MNSILNLLSSFSSKTNGPLSGIKNASPLKFSLHAETRPIPEGKSAPHVNTCWHTWLLTSYFTQEKLLLGICSPHSTERSASVQTHHNAKRDLCSPDRTQNSIALAFYINWHAMEILKCFWIWHTALWTFSSNEHWIGTILLIARCEVCDKISKAEKRSTKKRFF